MHNRKHIRSNTSIFPETNFEWYCSVGPKLLSSDSVGTGNFDNSSYVRVHCILAVHDHQIQLLKSQDKERNRYYRIWLNLAIPSMGSDNWIVSLWHSKVNVIKEYAWREHIAFARAQIYRKVQMIFCILFFSLGRKLKRILMILVLLSTATIIMN